MVVHDIRIATSNLLELAGQIRQINERLNDGLNQMEARLRQTESLWQSEAGNEIRYSMMQMKQNFFEQYHTMINAYADFLEQAANEYEITENTIKTNASEFM